MGRLADWFCGLCHIHQNFVARALNERDHLPLLANLISGVPDVLKAIQRATVAR
jgi:hypothetical protein